MQQAQAGQAPSVPPSICSSVTPASPASQQAHTPAGASGQAPDPPALELLLFQPVFGYELTACHVNHGLRGEPADRDEAFVRAECARLNVPLRVFHPADVGAAVPAHPGEDWARKLRYACFDALRAGGIDAVATAHTATDQTETLLFRLARGAGLHGAAGIRPSRPGFCRRPRDCPRDRGRAWEWLCSP